MTTGVLRHSRADALLVMGALAHGALLVTAPPALVVAVALWWNANTVAHNFIHLPFFRGRAPNAFFSVYLSLVLGLPQTLWRDRHLAHHAGRPWRLRWSRALAVESAIACALWTMILSRGAEVAATWIAGWIGGLCLCAVHGRYEHVRGTVSHYGAIYNVLFFNDGYHVEHHAWPREHWTRLPRRAEPSALRSAWPAVLRWIEPAACGAIEALERLVLRSRVMRWGAVACHTRALRRLLADVPAIHRVTIVGGGLFPRTALIMRRLAPDAEITIVDRSRDNIDHARRFLDERVRLVEATYAPELCAGADLLVVPLSYAGDRHAVYENPPAPLVAVHDWIWNVRGRGAIVSIFLLKRINLLERRG